MTDVRTIHQTDFGRLVTNAVEQIRHRGWTVIDLDVEHDLLDLARAFGTPVPTRRGASSLARLRIWDRDAARPNSLSARYGTAAFPFHTDAAFLRVPPEIGLMRLRPGGASRRPTLFFDL